MLLWPLLHACECAEKKMASLTSGCLGLRPALAPRVSCRPTCARAVSGFLPARNNAALTSRAHLAGASNLTLRPVAKVRTFRSPIHSAGAPLAAHVARPHAWGGARRLGSDKTISGAPSPEVAQSRAIGERRAWVSKDSLPVQSSPAKTPARPC